MTHIGSLGHGRSVSVRVPCVREPFLDGFQSTHLSPGPTGLFLHAGGSCHLQIWPWAFQNPEPSVNIPISTKMEMSGAPQNGTIGFDPQPYDSGFWLESYFQKRNPCFGGPRQNHPQTERTFLFRVQVVRGADTKASKAGESVAFWPVVISYLPINCPF